MNFTKRSLEILESFRSKQNIQSVADRFGTIYGIIRNNYFKHFWKAGYLIRIGYGDYVISEKGKEKIKTIEFLYKIDHLILIEARKGTSNKEIIKLIEQKYNINWTDGQVHGKITRYKKKLDIPDRRKVSCKIPRKFSPQLAELIGLIFSDGYIHRHSVAFYNKDIALLNRFQHLVSLIFNLNNPYKRERQTNFFEIKYYSIDSANFLNQLIQNKSIIPAQILNGNKNIKTSFLRGYFSGDGCIVLSVSNKKFYRQFQIRSFLFLACRRFEITKTLKMLFNSLGYSVKINSKGLLIIRFKEIIKFYNEIGFINNSNIANYSKWKGSQKNQLLSYVATSTKKDYELKQLRCTNRTKLIKYIKLRLKNTKPKIY